jgi:hypothetical protein
LQEIGQVVNSIIMLESFYVDESIRGEWLAIPRLNMQKDRMLRSINALLAFTSPEFVLINEKEINPMLSDQAFFEQLIQIAIEKGTTKTEKQLRTSAERLEKMLTTLDLSLISYNTLPLSNPSSVEGFYFYGQSGSLFGEHESYFKLIDKGRIYDYGHCCENWKKQIPSLIGIPVEASNHMTLMTEPKSQEAIIEFCTRLYSGKQINDDFVKSISISTKSQRFTSDEQRQTKRLGLLKAIFRKR